MSINDDLPKWIVIIWGVGRIDGKVSYKLYHSRQVSRMDAILGLLHANQFMRRSVF